MQKNDLDRGALVAGAAGAVLFLSLWLPWFGVSELGFSVNANAWQSFGFIDVVLFFTSLAAVGVAALTVVAANQGEEVELPAPPSLVPAALGGLGTLLVVYRILDPVLEADRRIGLLVGFLAVAGVVAGSVIALMEAGFSVTSLSGGGVPTNAAPPAPRPTAPPVAPPARGGTPPPPPRMPPPPPKVPADRPPPSG